MVIGTIASLDCVVAHSRQQYSVMEWTTPARQFSTWQGIGQSRPISPTPNPCSLTCLRLTPNQCCSRQVSGQGLGVSEREIGQTGLFTTIPGVAQPMRCPLRYTVLLYGVCNHILPSVKDHPKIRPHKVIIITKQNTLYSSKIEKKVSPPLQKYATNIYNI